jgi:nucleotide-binding universal stress UspA family protein
MYQHILIPVENTAADETILKHIRGLARLTGGRLTLIHVADGFAARYQKSLNLVDSEEIVEDRAYLSKLDQEFKAEGFEVKTVLAMGDPVKEILNYATKENCDLIAMSTHGHGMFKDFLFGTVASEVRHRTDIPVLLIRMPQGG